jgi:hypothetical protein
MPIITKREALGEPRVELFERKDNLLKSLAIMSEQPQVASQVFFLENGYLRAFSLWRRDVIRLLYGGYFGDWSISVWIMPDGSFEIACCHCTETETEAEKIDRDIQKALKDNEPYMRTQFLWDALVRRDMNTITGMTCDEAIAHLTKAWKEVEESLDPDTLVKMRAFTHQ